MRLLSGLYAILFLQGSSPVIKKTCHPHPWMQGRQGRFLTLQGIAPQMCFMELWAAEEGHYRKQRSVLPRRGNVWIPIDLSNISNINDALKGIGPYGQTVTSQELRYIRDNWNIFKNVVQFCKDGQMVELQWWKK